ncbi:MAG: ABC transporter permease [Chloroflexi bacterium]|nr:ABC transporter permease [Chloroflexota bacterium]
MSQNPKEPSNTLTVSAGEVAVAGPGSTPLPVLPKEKPFGRFRDFFRRISKIGSARVGFVLLVIVVGSAIFAPFIAPFKPDAVDPPSRLQPPSFNHLFGTDALGRDMFSRVIFGAQLTLQIGVIALAIAAFFGILIGLVTGYYGGWIDGLLMRFIDLLLAFPGILLALMIVSTLGPNLTNAMIAVGISSIPGFARLVRGSVLSIREHEYITAARALGVSSPRILFKAILPNAMAPIIVLATLLFPDAVLVAASLSFIGLGAQPPSPEWGALLVDGRLYIQSASWLITFPGLAIFITIMGSNLLGNALRDVLDPHLRGR